MPFWRSECRPLSLVRCPRFGASAGHEAAKCQTHVPDGLPLSTARRRRPGKLRAMGSHLSERSAALIRAIHDGDEQMVEDTVRALSQSRRILAPLVFAIGAFVMLFDGVRLLVLNWRLTLVQLLPTMWIWIAMYDLKAHTFRGKSLEDLSGPVLIPIVLAIVAITAASFFFNAVFAFAIAGPAPPKSDPRSDKHDRTSRSCWERAEPLGSSSASPPSSWSAGVASGSRSA